MFRRFISILIILIGTSSAIGAEPSKIEFDHLPQIVREKNQHVQAAGLLLEAAKRETGHLGRSFLPEITAEAGHESFRTGLEENRSEPFGSVGAELNVFRSGKDQLDEKIKSAAVEAAQAEFEDVYRSELRKTRETFWVLAFQREMHLVLSDALEKNETFLKAAGRKINSGLSTTTDRIEFEMARREIEQHLSRLQTESNRASRTLAVLTNETGPIETPAQIPHDHDDVLLTASFDASSHSSVRGLKAAYASEKLAARQASRWWAPSVDVYSNYSLYTFREREYDSQSDRDETVAGGKVSLPFFDGMKSRTASRSSSLRAESVAKMKDQAERELQADADSVKDALQKLHDLVHSAEEGVSLGERYLKSTLDEYARGVKNSPDLVGAVEKLVGVKRRYAEIRLDYQLMRTHLLSLVETLN
jgi:outer membrane protein